jgi:hypothetical protein
MHIDAGEFKLTRAGRGSSSPEVPGGSRRASWRCCDGASISISETYPMICTLAGSPRCAPQPRPPRRSLLVKPELIMRPQWLSRLRPDR